MLVVEPDHETNDEGEWGLEWTVIGQSGGGNDEQVEEETKNGKTDDDPSDGVVDSEEVLGECITKEE